MEQRPNLTKDISLKDFQDFYWLKEELMAFCRAEGLRTSGGKIEIAQRIAHYLQTGEKKSPKLAVKAKTSSKFDWNKEALTLETVITDNYKNSENVRAFFEQQIGKGFKFNVKFMNWMKANVGETLQAAIDAWKRLEEEKKANKQPKEIAPQFEYNRYLRDFMADNPNADRATGIKLWKIKRSMRGDNVYRKSDLEWLNKT